MKPSNKQRAKSIAQLSHPVIYSKMNTRKKTHLIDMSSRKNVTSINTNYAGTNEIDKFMQLSDQIKEKYYSESYEVSTLENKSLIELLLSNVERHFAKKHNIKMMKL